jgi:hypothetical protein
MTNNINSQSPLDPGSGSGGLMLNIDVGLGLTIILSVVVFLLLIALTRKLINYFTAKKRYHYHKIFLVKLPRDTADDNKETWEVQRLREEIAKAETIFSSIGGLTAQRGFKAWLLGRDDHFSFEIVANREKIGFYVVAPYEMASYIEQQIHAHYPEASIEEVEDYNIFHPRAETLGSYIKTKRSFIFPIRTYNKDETDPMNSLVNVMSKLQTDDGMSIQILARSAKGSWHKKPATIAKEVAQGKSINEALKSNKMSKGLNILGEIVDAAKPSSDKNEKEQRREEPRKMSEMEQEMVKGIEEKNYKAGMDVNIRVVVSTRDKARAKAYLSNIDNAFSQYNYYEYGNSFKIRVPAGRGQKKLIQDFIYRRFSEKNSFLLNTEELASIYHFPLKNTDIPNIEWLTAKHAQAPSNVPDEGILLGYNAYRGVKKEVRIKREDRRRHSYIIGKSGTGKSKYIASMAIQDIINGEGVCLMDPHGDLIEDVMERIPPERAEDVIFFAPADGERPLGINLLEFDPDYPEQKTFVVNEMIKIFDKLYDLQSTGGPVFEQYMRNAMLLIMSDPSSGSTLMEIPKVLADPEFRKMKLERCNDSTVVDFWRKEAEKAGGEAALANVVPYITSKLTSFISNDTMRPIIAQQESAFNLRKVMDDQKILLVDLSKGKLGEMNAHLLGMILVGKILMSALSRTDIASEKRKDFYLYIDEFQNFTTDSICSILSEARKYNLNLIMAHQYLGQLVEGQDSSIKDAVFGNVGSWTLFKIGSEDAEVMEKEFAPVFSQYDLVNIEKYTAYVKLLIDNAASRPFSMNPIWPLPGTAREDVAEKIRNISRLKYGRDRNIIESEIKERTTIY